MDRWKEFASLSVEEAADRIAKTAELASVRKELHVRLGFRKRADVDWGAMKDWVSQNMYQPVADWAQANPQAAWTTAGAAGGGLLGLLSSLAQKKEDRKPWHSFLAGALGGAGAGFGGHYLANSPDVRNVYNWFKDKLVDKPVDGVLRAGSDPNSQVLPIPEAWLQAGQAPDGTPIPKGVTHADAEWGLAHETEPMSPAAAMTGGLGTSAALYGTAAEIANQRGGFEAQHEVVDRIHKDLQRSNATKNPQPADMGSSGAKAAPEEAMLRDQIDSGKAGMPGDGFIDPNTGRPPEGKMYYQDPRTGDYRIVDQPLWNELLSRDTSGNKAQAVKQYLDLNPQLFQNSQLRKSILANPEWLTSGHDPDSLFNLAYGGKGLPEQRPKFDEMLGEFNQSKNRSVADHLNELITARGNKTTQHGWRSFLLPDAGAQTYGMADNAKRIRGLAQPYVPGSLTLPGGRRPLLKRTLPLVGGGLITAGSSFAIDPLRKWIFGG